jgi:hypothetical protein
VTNVCNAACDFCGFARDQALVGSGRYLEADAFARALPLLFIRFEAANRSCIQISCDCMMACYRNASMLMHAAVATADAGRALAAGRIGAAAASLFQRGVAQSPLALAEAPPQARCSRSRGRRAF